MHGNQRFPDNPVNHQLLQQMPEPTSGAVQTSGDQMPGPTPPWRAGEPTLESTPLCPAGGPPDQSNQQPASAQPRPTFFGDRVPLQSQPQLTTTAKEEKEESSGLAEEPGLKSSWSTELTESCLFGTAELEPPTLAKLEMATLPTQPEEEWTHPEDESDEVGPRPEGSRGVPAGAAVPADGQDEMHPDDEAWWVNTMNQTSNRSIHTQVRPQGSKRPGHNAGPEVILKRLCGTLINVLAAMDKSATRVLELQAYGSVDRSICNEQHATAMSDHKRLRHEVSEIHSMVVRMHSTPETPPIEQTPQTPPPQTAQTRSCTGNCMSGCRMCFPGLR